MDSGQGCVRMRRLSMWETGALGTFLGSYVLLVLTSMLSSCWGILWLKTYHTGPPSCIINSVHRSCLRDRHMHEAALLMPNNCVPDA